MKAEYDFSKGERGKFYDPEAELATPIYLERDVMAYLGSRAEARGVDIVYRILERELVGDRGGIGTYKNESGLFNRQMVHFDLRGHRARWHR